MTVINKILKALRDRDGIEIDLSSIPIDDKKTFELLSSGDIDAEFYVDVVKSPLNNVELPCHALQKNFNEL
jgi:hypothetical protein